MWKPRLRVVLLAVPILIGSWYVMLGVHELGHCLAAWLSGGRVERVIVPLFGLSRTDVAAGGRTALVVWAGPIVGALLPVAAHLVARRAWPNVRWITALVAGFCVIANGGYLTGSAAAPAGDGEELIAMGAPRWLLAVVGLPMLAAGLWLWNAVGTGFGFGAERRIETRAIAGAWAASAAVIVLVAVLGGG